MTDPGQAEFDDLIRRVRAGDEQAAFELVRRYEGEIRREVRLRLKGRHLRRLVDSMDVCQSVLGSFFVRAASGEFEIESPRKLLHLLVRMATNRVTDWARRLRASRRDALRDRALDGLTEAELSELHAGPSPSAAVSAAELYEEFQRRLSDEERALFERRVAGRAWTEIAEEMGEGAEALRKRLERGRRRVVEELGLD